MIVDVKYGKDGVQRTEIPDESYIGTFYPKDVECGDPDDAIGRSIDGPMGFKSLSDFLSGGKDVVFIVNDGTRPTPTAKVLKSLSKRMDLRSARFLIATGTHRDMTPEEYGFVFGDLYGELRDRIICHDSKNSECVRLGVSKNGTPMEVNRIAVEADRLVIITSVEPHYFAGYTGGRKSFLPGVASYATVEANHRLAMSRDAQSLALEGNPVHEDMMDALEVVKDKKIFSIQMVLDRHQNIYKVASGALNPAFDRAVEWANEVFSVPIPQKADVVISVAPYPMDVDLYQSQKALDNGKWALKEGGKIIMVSKCREGIGHSAFLTQLSTSRDPAEVLENLKCEYKLGYHKAAKMAEIATWADIWAVTDLDPETIRSANITPFPSVDDAVKAALAWKADAKFIVLMDGSVTIPRVGGFDAENTAKVGRALNTCTMCGFCKSVCPSFKAIGWDSALSRGRVALAYGLLHGDIPADDSVVENMYTCTTCADCVRRCPSKVDVVEVIETCRSDLVRNGRMLPRHRAMVDSVRRNGNPYGEEGRAADQLGSAPRKAPIGYFAGCTAAYRSKKTASSTLSVLGKMGADFTTVDEVCCGSVMQRVGVDEREVVELMRRNVAAVAAAGVETLVLSCAGCYRMFKIEYPKHVEVPFEVLHISEFLAGADLKLSPMAGKVTYHDPCHLGRHCGVYDAPREVLKKFPGIDFKEMDYSRATSHCCGGGGGVRSAYPETSAAIARSRLAEAAFADTIVTSCPFCVTNLGSSKGDSAVRVVDLVELVDEHLAP
ncbi:MAG: nickel-dependent lactate racemase [Candidatus Methanoplasma sp.]|jgi:Fe-S oxidoreductase/nickel-dependent lactate racemase|nr:nickel-dependent lactate racemase [Candidatus Methanoplasma sp.]